MTPGEFFGPADVVFNIVKIAPTGTTTAVWHFRFKDACAVSSWRVVARARARAIDATDVTDVHHARNDIYAFSCVLSFIHFAGRSHASRRRFVSRTRNSYFTSSFFFPPPTCPSPSPFPCCNKTRLFRHGTAMASSSTRSDHLSDHVLLFQAKLETKALKAKRPGFTDERYNETSYYVEHGQYPAFFFSSGFRFNL